MADTKADELDRPAIEVLTVREVYHLVALTALVGVFGWNSTKPDQQPSIFEGARQLADAMLAQRGEK